MAKKAQQRIFEEAQKLFYKFGIRRVTVDEICREAGITRKTFYTYYSNKTALALSILKSIMIEAQESSSALYSNDKFTFAEKLKQIVIIKQEFAQKTSAEFVTDLLLAEDVEIASVLMEYRIIGCNTFSEAFAAAKKNGEIRESVSLDVFMMINEHLESLYVQPSFQEHFNGMSDMTEKVCDLMFNGIFKNDK